MKNKNINFNIKDLIYIGCYINTEYRTDSDYFKGVWEHNYYYIDKDKNHTYDFQLLLRLDTPIMFDINHKEARKRCHILDLYDSSYFLARHFMDKIDLWYDPDKFNWNHYKYLFKYCEAWKENKLERQYIKRLNELIGLKEEQIFYEEVLCDWNCLHGVEYFDENTKTMKEYPLDLDKLGENYQVAYGMDIDYFPAIYIKLYSSQYKAGKEPYEIVFQGLGAELIKTKKFQIFDKEYQFEEKTLEVKILKPLMKFLRSLNAEDSSIPINEKFSLFLGQYHRHSD